VPGSLLKLLTRPVPQTQERLDLLETALHEAIQRLTALASLRLVPADQDEMSQSYTQTQSSAWLQLWYDYKDSDDSEDVSPGATG